MTDTGADDESLVASGKKLSGHAEGTNRPETFDAYHEWLGIPPKDQPPNHYRLLGIELFESQPPTSSSMPPISG